MEAFPDCRYLAGEIEYAWGCIFSQSISGVAWFGVWKTVSLSHKKSYKGKPEVRDRDLRSLILQLVLF